MAIVKATPTSRSRSALLLALAASWMLLAPAAAQSKDPTTDLSKWSKEDLAKAEAFVRTFLDDLAGDHSERVIAAFDTTALLDKAFDGIGTPQQRVEMRRGGKETIGQSLLGTLKNVGQGARKYKRLVAVDGTLRARVRFYGQRGISILDLELTRLGDGWAFQDIHNLTVGVSMIHEMRILASMLLARSPGLLARLFGTDSLSTKDCDNMTAMAQSLRSGDAAKAKSLHDKLPKALQESSSITGMHLQMLAAGSDENSYVAALESAAARFPAPMFRMMMVDAHFLRKRWQEAVRCIDEAMQGIEPDAMLMMLRASIQLQIGDVAAATKSTTEALALEPDSLEVLVASLDVVLAAKDWAAVVRTIEALEKSKQYDFKGQLEDDAWAEFRKQPEAKPWL